MTFGLGDEGEVHQSHPGLRMRAVLGDGEAFLRTKQKGG